MHTVSINEPGESLLHVTYNAVDFEIPAVWYSVTVRGLIK